jgi:hypothetical protein
MSHIRCPLCGKDSSISHFNPDELDLDIYVRSHVGLGYRGGFAPTQDESVLGDDEFTPKIKNRCIDLLNLFVEQGIIDRRELTLLLRMGVPVQGSDQIVSYEDFMRMLSQKIEAKDKRISILESQVRVARGGVSMPAYEDLKTRYDKLVYNNNVKRKIEKILKYLRENLDSQIILGDDDWKLEIYESIPEVFIYLCKKLYELNKGEREMLQNRITTDCVEFMIIFQMFKDKPTITSMTEVLNNEPDRFYYRVHNLPIPDHLKTEEDFSQGINWETFST